MRRRGKSIDSDDQSIVGPKSAHYMDIKDIVFACTHEQPRTLPRTCVIMIKQVVQ